jgi:hypothetical protein
MFALAMRVADVTKGHHILFIPENVIEYALKLGFWVFVLAPITNSLIKISLSLMFFRIKGKDYWWRVGLWSMIAILIIILFSSSLSIIFSCTPVSGFWHISERLGGHCLSISKNADLSYGFGCRFKS